MKFVAALQSFLRRCMLCMQRRSFVSNFLKIAWFSKKIKKNKFFDLICNTFVTPYVL